VAEDPAPASTDETATDPMSDGHTNEASADTTTEA
jgi:hypothetical protein